MKLFDFSFKEKLLNFLKEKNVDLNDIKSIILAVKKDDKNYVINFIPKQQGDFNFSNLLYKNKEMSKEELSGYENSPDIAVIHFDKNNNLQLSSDMFFKDDGDKNMSLAEEIKNVLNNDKDINKELHNLSVDVKGDIIDISFDIVPDVDDKYMESDNLINDVESAVNFYFESNDIPYDIIRQQGTNAGIENSGDGTIVSVRYIGKMIKQDREDIRKEVREQELINNKK